MNFRNMRFQLLLHITHIISRAIYFSWVIFLAIGLLDIRTFAETSVNKTKEINSIIKNLSNNETLKNESSLIIPTTEKLLRMPHKLEYYSIKRVSILQYYFKKTFHLHIFIKFYISVLLS